MPYVDGFVLAVPKDKIEAYKALARKAGVLKANGQPPRVHDVRHYLAPRVMLSKAPSRGGSLALWPERLDIIRVL